MTEENPFLLPPNKVGICHPMPGMEAEAAQWALDRRDARDAEYIRKHGMPNQYARATSWRNRRR
jgi:hypothetical protein